MTNTVRERAQVSLRSVAIVVGMLLGIILVFSFLLLVAVGKLQDTTNSLKTSSARSECRTAVTNEAEDTNRHDNAAVLRDITDLIKQSDAGQLALARATLQHAHDKADAIVNAPHVQTVIDETCPKPLVKVATTTTSRKHA